MTLIPQEEKQNSLKWITGGVTNSAGILAIKLLAVPWCHPSKLPIADALSASLLGLGVGVFLPFIIAALLKTAMGASA
ncbi:MAG: hypothetical protein ACLSE4_02175 [Clostridium sp.]